MQFAPANATPKIAKEYVLPAHTFGTSIKTMENQAGRGKPAYNNV
ncbi:hypothetical protein [Ichthyenterobacterium magnum]|nr:hypothetical protein [Ichthyenterobacterium magnum]